MGHAEARYQPSHRPWTTFSDWKSQPPLCILTLGLDLCLRRSRTCPAMSKQDLIKIGEFATLAGTNLRTLRYYEELGLLKPTLRSDGGFRYYRRASAQRVAMIRDLQELGLPLERIREIVGIQPKDGDRTALLQRVRRALEEHQLLLAAHLDALKAQQGRLETALAKLKDCSCCDELPAADNNFCDPCGSTGECLPEGLRALF